MILKKARAREIIKEISGATDLKLKLDAISNDLKKGERSEDFNNNLLVVSNEIKKELIALPEIKFIMLMILHLKV